MVLLTHRYIFGDELSRNDCEGGIFEHGLNTVKVNIRQMLLYLRHCHSVPYRANLCLAYRILFLENWQSPDTLKFSAQIQTA